MGGSSNRSDLRPHARASLRLSGGFCRLIVLAGCDVFSGRPCRSSTRNSSARRDGTM
ncbi:hypothetical protein GW17_00016705, partial [Ensete ventricosum]